MATKAKWARRCVRAWRGAGRSLSPAAVAVSVALVVGGAGIADAATGGAFLLGKANTENAKATLANTRGTPLALSAPPGKAPLAVNRKALVQNLNAQYVGGLSAGSLKATGGIGVTSINANIHISSDFSVVASTGRLPTGLYYVTATALVDVAAGGGGAFCIITDSAGKALSYGGASQENFMQAAETALVFVAAGGVVQERCNTVQNTATSAVYDAGIAAIRVLSSSGTRV
jgi:hypothetical protein